MIISGARTNCNWKTYGTNKEIHPDKTLVPLRYNFVSTSMELWFHLDETLVPP